MTPDDTTTASLQARFGILDAEQQARKRFIDLTPADERALRDIQPLVAANADAIVDGFYRNIDRHAELQAIIAKAGSNVERLRSAQKQYLLELFSGDYGAEYVERRLKIGVIHNRIGLTPKWYLGSYSVYMQLITRLLRRRYFLRPGKVMRYVSALDKILSFDAQLAIDTYIGALVGDLKAVSLDKGGIERTVSRYADFVARVAQGDLSQRLEVTGEGDLGLLGEQLNSMTEGLATMASQTRDVSVVLSSTLDDLLGNVQSHASAAAQQAAAVSQATATLEQIRTIAQRNQEHVQQLGDMAERTRTEGERGQQLVDDSVNSMADIRRQVHGIAENILALSERTQQIGAITGTVNDLAHQLKMLALNASIEAAQAGEAGKGFAVVASEVKNLAEQSQRATEQVDGILSEIRNATDRAVMATEDGGKGVDKGSQQVQQAGLAVRALADAIAQSAHASETMATAVRQEGQGIEQVTVAMTEIDGATRQFLGAAEQTRNVTERLSSLAQRMARSVQAYRLR